MFQWRVLAGKYVWYHGLALSHPLYIAAGRLLLLFSRNHLPLLLNCFSGVGMAVALANVAAVVTRLTSRARAGLLAAAVLAVAHTAWWLATIAEVYTWSVAGLTAEVWLLVLLLRKPRWHLLAGLALVNGLGLCVHNFALLPLPVYATVAVALAVKRRIPAWSLAAAAGAWIVGAGVYLGMTVHLAVTGGSWVGAALSALMGRYGPQVLNVAAASPQWKANVVLSAMNFTGVLLPLAIVGWARLTRHAGRPIAWSLCALTIVHATFFLRYPVPDQFTFILPTLTMIAIAAGVGVAALMGISARWRVAVSTACLLSLIWQPVLYALAPALAKRLAPTITATRVPLRDEARYWLVPWKHNEQSARDFAETALAEASPDGAIIPDSTCKYALKLAQELWGIGRDVTIQFAGSPIPSGPVTEANIRRVFAGRRLYVVSDKPGHAPKCVLDRADLDKTPGGALYRVRWRE